MFSLKGLLRTIGVSLLSTIFVSFILGFLNINNVVLSIGLIFIVSYITVGITAPIWNPLTPYFASYIGSLILTILNFIVAIYTLDTFVFFNPEGINNSIVISSMTSLLTTFIFIQIMKKKTGEQA